MCPIVMYITFCGGLQVVGGNQEQRQAASVWLASRDPVRLAAEARADDGSVRVRLNGRLLCLRNGEHFTLPALSAGALGSASQLANGA